MPINEELLRKAQLSAITGQPIELPPIVIRRNRADTLNNRAPEVVDTSEQRRLRQTANVINTLAEPAERVQSFVRNFLGTNQTQPDPEPVQQAVQPSTEFQTAQKLQGVEPATEQTKKPNKFMQFLKRAGIPLGSAIAGSIDPDLLPQAAGLSTGFTEELKRQQEQEGTKDFVIVDPETGNQQVFKVPKKALVQQKSKGNDLASVIGSLGLELPEQKTGSAVKRAKEKIQEFDSVEAANAADLPKGTEIMINGRKAIIE